MQTTSEAAPHREKWFEHFLNDEIMPRLKRAATAATQSGASAQCRQINQESGTAAELIIVPRGLPHDARPPCLTISLASEGERPLAVDITGNFPNVGVGGGFGAEINYDSVYPDQLDEQITRFMALATGQ